MENCDIASPLVSRLSGVLSVTEYIQVMTTLPNEEDAKNLARILVTARLAACVQVLGSISSVYWWKDNIVEEEEYLCFIKTREELYGDLESAIIKNHPYQTPEIIATPVTAGSSGYFAWLDDHLKEKEK